jgi:hypothetical protein
MMTTVDTHTHTRDAVTTNAQELHLLQLAQHTTITAIVLAATEVAQLY